MDPEILGRLDAIDDQLAAATTQQAGDTEAILAALEKLDDRWVRAVEDLEESLQQVLPLMIVLWRRDAATKLPRGTIEDPADAAANLHHWLAGRKAR